MVSDPDKFLKWFSDTVSDDEVREASKDWYGESPDTVRKKQKEWMEQRYDAIPKKLDKGRQEIVRENFFGRILPDNVLDLPDDEQRVLIYGTEDAKYGTMREKIVDAAEVQEASEALELHRETPIQAAILRHRIRDASKDKQWQEVERLQGVADKSLTTATQDEESALSVWQTSIDTKKAAGRALPVRTRLLASEFERAVEERWLQYDIDIGADGVPVPFRQWRPATNPDRAITDNDRAALALVRQNDFRLRLQGGGGLDVARTQWLEEQQWRNYQGRLQDQYLA